MKLILAAAGLQALTFAEAGHHIHHDPLHHASQHLGVSSSSSALTTSSFTYTASSSAASSFVPSSDTSHVASSSATELSSTSSSSVSTATKVAVDDTKILSNERSTSDANLTSPFTQDDNFLAQVSALWSRNHSVITTAETMLALSSGADYDFYREDDVGNLAYNIEIVFSNMTAAEAAGYGEDALYSSLDSIAKYLKGITNIVNNNIGGTTRNDTLEELSYTLQSFAKASETLDNYQTGDSSLTDKWMTSSDRTGLVTALEAIMNYAIEITPQWYDSSFNYISFTGVCSAAEEIKRLASVHSFTADVSTYVSYVEQMFYGFYHDLTGSIINTTTPVSFKVDNRTEMYGGDNEVYLSWGDWKPVLSTMDVEPADYTQGSGTTSDSSGYLIGDFINLGSAVMMLQQSQASNDTLTNYLSDEYIQALADFIEYYTALFIGVVDSDTGFIPPYGDANWGDDGATQWVMMEMGATLVKTLNPTQASRLKYYANMAARFTLNWNSEFTPLWRYGLTNTSDIVASAPTTANVTKSSILSRDATWGASVPSKVALRGYYPNMGTNGVALINTLSSDSFGHSHSVAGSIVAHAYDSSIILRSLGYSASYDVLQNNLVVRKTPDSNTSFLSYEQLSGTEGHHSPIQAYKWSATELSDTTGITGDVTQEDGDRIAYMSITRQIITGKIQVPDNGYNFHMFHHTRQIVMDKSNGALHVYDAIRPNETIEAGMFSFGQLFHVSEILSNVTDNVNGVTSIVGQNGPWFETNLASQERGRPFLLQLAGGDKSETVWWSFDAMMATYADGWAKFHIHTETDAGALDPTTSTGYVAAVIPFGTDNNATSVDTSDVPTGVTTSVDSNGNAVSGYAGLCITFRTNGSYTATTSGDC